MPIYNFLENNSNYSNVTGSWPFYSKDESTPFTDNNACNIFKSFENKAKLLRGTVS